ncbi:hypothetical protein PTSG_12769 [Salpingoeca rosetta]|uniref:Uncharacterized protein n=1 Tax=Salpingoeca rosetta (strain ATCC 50818 / BSB-021) TaxID=946362 RepID=F2UKC3_SALR5|nr:uncharacterized protein PTSG_12769 [Salpingoeca rosetta]EGD77572.1 hypothetical protein PTSG_12769 [Salpingoeca rosetta]|eukprot:XP_004990460.1 hypothetical protein PTSG_12769 [Salpingoeca rosetta]
MCDCSFDWRKHRKTQRQTSCRTHTPISSNPLCWLRRCDSPFPSFIHPFALPSPLSPNCHQPNRHRVASHLSLTVSTTTTRVVICFLPSPLPLFLFRSNCLLRNRPPPPKMPFTVGGRKAVSKIHAMLMRHSKSLVIMSSLSEEDMRQLDDAIKTTSSNSE